MEAHFWHEKWQNREIAFHEGEPNALMVKHFSALALKPNSNIFVPLCGKTRDIAWLLKQGFKVTGVELNETAIRELFEELGLEPYIKEVGSLLHYSAPNISIFVGDIFRLNQQHLNAIDATYDRAALVALPEDLRKRYTKHLISISGGAKQLVITFEYDQEQMDGPPFAISHKKIHDYYDSIYDLEKLETKDVEGGLKGTVTASENAWLLKPQG